jgi:phosphoribosylamine--glycine ligase
MKVLVIGGGGREHAIAWKLSRSGMVRSVICVPGNGGISDLARCIEMDVNDSAGLVRFSREESVDFVVVGPENPLAGGIVDAFRQEGIPIFGPDRKGALLEASKIFSKELMAKHGIPTAGFQVFTCYDKALDYLRNTDPPFVIKADGLCAGKGAYVIHERTDGEKVLKELMVQEIYGKAGREVIVESFLPGIEASYIAFTDGITTLPMLPSQDHKPLLDDDRGPNTGGMGAYTPIPFINGELSGRIDRDVMDATIAALGKEGIIYRGALYGGLMLQGADPYVIEFNARFGDPETQPLLFHMESDIMPLLVASAEGNLKNIESIAWKPGVSICVVLASAGYPEKPEKGKLIKGLEDLKNREDVMVFHAGTRKIDGAYYTSGGRVLGVTATGTNYKDAIEKVYDAVSHVHFDGMQYRKDIGRKAVQARICTGSGI